jgi:CheY-like chemotaxis protein
MSGLELLAELKSSESTARVPVLLVTGDNRVQASDLQSQGAAGIVYKPFRIPELVKVIEDVLAQSQRATAATLQAA